MNERLRENIANHPCYAAGCHGRTARIHLPVAPRCNISCNFCVRKFDCVNESRPGVTSKVLKPEQALERFRVARAELGNLAVVGIAGPGDPLANWPAVRETFRLVRGDDPDVALCLSTNGLYLPYWADEVIAAGISHVTVTVNAVDEEVGARIYDNVVYEKIKRRGRRGARLLIRNQLEGIRLLAAAGVLVKANMVLIDGVNVEHAEEVARAVAEAGAVCQNMNSLIPVPGSAFQDVRALTAAEVNAVRSKCAPYLQQIRHCRQCRADAVGELGCDISARVDELVRKLGSAPDDGGGASTPPSPAKRIAVATNSGIRVDAHFGHADRFHIYEVDGAGPRFAEAREADPFCHGKLGCGDYEGNVFEQLGDCDAVVCAWAGPGPRGSLEDAGIRLFDGSAPASPAMADACSGGSVALALAEAYRLLIRER